jgi:hypothetical protein
MRTEPVPGTRTVPGTGFFVSWLVCGAYSATVTCRLSKAT